MFSGVKLSNKINGSVVRPNQKWEIQYGDPENIDIAVRISFLSRLQAEICVLPVYAHHYCHFSLLVFSQEVLSKVNNEYCYAYSVLNKESQYHNMNFTKFISQMGQPNFDSEPIPNRCTEFVKFRFINCCMITMTPITVTCSTKLTMMLQEEIVRI